MGRQLIARALVLALVLTSSAVRADEPAEAPPVPETPSPAPEPAPTGPSAEQKAEARRRFEQGVALAKAGNCDAALAELGASFDLVPRANTLYNMGQCSETLGLYADAVATYERFLAMAAPDDPDRRVVEAQIASLRRLLGTIVLRSNVEAEVWLGERKVGTSPGQLLVAGGRHTLELRRQGYEPLREEVELAGGRTVELDLTLVKLAPKVIRQNTVIERKAKGLPRVIFWSGVAATGVALAVGAGFGARTLALQSDAEGLDPRLPRDVERDAIETSAAVADVSFLAAGVLGVGTTVLFFLTDWGDAEAKVTPTIVPGGAAVSWGGRW